MLKVKKLPSKRTSKSELIAKAKTKEDLLQIPGFVVYLFGENNEAFRIKTSSKCLDFIDLDDELIRIGIHSDGIQQQIFVNVTRDDVGSSLKMVEQPSTCANLIIHSLSFYDKVTSEYLLKLVDFFAEYAEYTTVRATTYSNREAAHKLSEHGYEASEAYTNSRTLNELADFKLIL